MKLARETSRKTERNEIVIRVDVQKLLVDQEKLNKCVTDIQDVVRHDYC